MARLNIRVTLRDTNSRLDQLVRYRAQSLELSPRFQHFVAEVVLLRLSSVLELAIENIVCKLVAGSDYINGSSPMRLHAARSVSGAFSLMNPKGRVFLQWNSESNIRANASLVLDMNDPLFTRVAAHNIALDEMRRVRNRIAHNSSKAKQEFRDVVRRTYGANASVTTGAFLTSMNRHPVAKINEYLVRGRTIVQELVAGQP